MKRRTFLSLIDDELRSRADAAGDLTSTAPPNSAGSATGC
jgi:hypothetical protein